MNVTSGPPMKKIIPEGALLAISVAITLLATACETSEKAKPHTAPAAQAHAPTLISQAQPTQKRAESVSASSPHCSHTAGMQKEWHR